MSSTSTTLVIDRLGSDGDGLARGADGRLIVVPFALPGETIVDGVATTRSPERAMPACVHFMQCGGCIAQHVGDALYTTWKRDLVVGALRQHKLEPEVKPLVRVPPRSRRRAAFAVAKGRDGVRLAFHRRRDTLLLPLDQCPVVTPRIEAALLPLAALVARLPGVTAATRVVVADLDGGLDVLIEGASSTLAAHVRADVAVLAERVGLARLSVGSETMIERTPVTLPGSVGVLRPVPGAFFQAVAVAEAAIVEAVRAGLPKKPKRIADLFAGLGTLTFPLARHAPVFAADSEKTALASLTAAARHIQGLKPITTRARDLIGEPLSPKELEVYDTVVLDPPRAGAKAQCEALARSKVETLVMVSCNPQSLARDLRILVDGGFALGTVTPIDQFLWSEHVEVVAVLQRK